MRWINSKVPAIRMGYEHVQRGGYPYRLVWRWLFPAWNDLPQKHSKFINFSFVTSWHPQFLSDFCLKFSRLKTYELHPRNLANGYPKWWTGWKKDTGFTTMAIFGTVSIREISDFFSWVWRVGECFKTINQWSQQKHHASPQQSWAFPNSHDDKIQKKTEHFPKHFVLEDFPKFSQVKLQSAIPPVPTRLCFLHQSNTGIKACVVVTALRQQLGVIIPPVEPALFIHHPACLGGWIWKNEMEKTHREIHSQRPFLCFFYRIFF